MKIKIANLVFVLMVSALSSMAYADPTSFAIYDASSGGNELTTTIPFPNREDIAVGTNAKQIVGNVYLQINNRTGSPTWRLIVYTQNGVKNTATDTSNLYWDNDSLVQMTWKYNNPKAGMGTETLPVGSTISDSRWESYYKWFVNAIDGGDSIIDVPGGDAVRTYVTVTRSTDTAIVGRMRLTFVADLKSTYLHGLYKSNLVFELAEN